jgi:hypothetical protein
MRTSAPPALALRRLTPPEAGTRSTSAKVQRMVPLVRANPMALSMRPTGSTQTGQPGPCTMRTLAGSRSWMP